MSNEIDMQAVYAEALFDVESPAGTISLSIGRPTGDPGPTLHRQLAVVTACNPGAARPGNEANALANERLRVTIEAAGWSYWPAVGRSPSGDHSEPSFAVLDI